MGSAPAQRPWADPLSLVVLHRLARAVPELAAVVIVTARPVEELLDVPPGRRRRLQAAAAGGNPVHVADLVRSLEAAGALEVDGEAEVAAVGMPASCP